MTAVKYHEGRFPPKDLDWPRLVPLIGPANAAVVRDKGLVREIRASSGSQPAILAFSELLNIAEGRPVF